MPATSQLSAAAMPFAPSDTSVSNDQQRNATQSQVSESDTRKVQSIPVSVGVSACVNSDGSNVSNVYSNVSNDSRPNADTSFRQ